MTDFHTCLLNAQLRSKVSYFDQHIIAEAGGDHVVIDEGDYAQLPMSLIDRIVYTVASQLSDDDDSGAYYATDDDDLFGDLFDVRFHDQQYEMRFPN